MPQHVNLLDVATRQILYSFTLTVPLWGDLNHTKRVYVRVFVVCGKCTLFLPGHLYALGLNRVHSAILVT